MDGLSYRLVGAISFCIWGIKGYRAVAPDMRGYGGSSVYAEHSAYAQREIVKDMIELIDSLGGDKAVWIGHDWGSPVAWNVALHHPERVAAVASLCVPFGFSGRPEDLEYAINRELYPADEYPAGQWDYQLFTTRTSIKHKKKWKRTQSGWRNFSSEKATQMDKDR